MRIKDARTAEGRRDGDSDGFSGAGSGAPLLVIFQAIDLSDWERMERRSET